MGDNTEYEQLIAADKRIAALEAEIATVHSRGCPAIDAGIVIGRGCCVANDRYFEFFVKPSLADRPKEE